MKNKIKFQIFLIFFYLTSIVNLNAEEQFVFDVTEIEITENGNIFKGYNRGKISVSNGIEIDANKFKYNKLKNVLYASGDVKINDTVKDIIIFAQDVTYLKEKEKIFTNKRSKTISKEIIIESDAFQFNKITNILNASGNVEINDTIKDITIFTKDITYLKNKEILFTKGKTTSIIESKYNFESKNIYYYKDKDMIDSNFKSSVLNKETSILYNFDKFKYFINTEFLKAENIFIVSDVNAKNGETDTYRLNDAFINLKNKKFTASKTQINLKKDVFDEKNNDPRLIGVSSASDNNITVVKKGTFTSCKKNDGCTPWSIKAKEIKHDKTKKQLIYDHAILNVYDVPVMYFPKFFHPDPSVERQSGFLKPQISESEFLGSSFYLPYYWVISDNKDYTFKPTIFDSEIKIFQNEYRQENEYSSFITDFSLVKGYQSSLPNSNRNSISHLFSKFNLNLNLENFTKSELDLSIQKVSNDTYLKVFDQNLMDTIIKPENSNNLKNELKISLDHENYNLTTGISSYENLQLQKSSDRFHYVLPYYSFSTGLFSKSNPLNFSSTGSNELINTNNLQSTIINDLDYVTNDLIFQNGVKNNFGIYLRNLNNVAKKDTLYKSTPRIEYMNIFELSSSLPLLKIEENYINTLTPKLSIKMNPGDMKDYSSSGRTVNVNNIFNINRLGIGDTYESGKSLTIGIDYKKEDIKDNQKYFEFLLATNLRDKEEDKLPIISTLNRKTSNLFGSIKNNFSENFNISYNFAIDNDYKTFEYNSIDTGFSINNFATNFTFIEENGEMGDSNIIENSTSFYLDESNKLQFKTRRNRKINLTEFYDLVYEYQNDCFRAGFKYKKTYYQDRDLRPMEDLMLTVTLYPLTTYEHEIDQNFYRSAK